MVQLDQPVLPMSEQPGGCVSLLSQIVPQLSQLHRPQGFALWSDGYRPEAALMAICSRLQDRWRHLHMCSHICFMLHHRRSEALALSLLWSPARLMTGLAHQQAP